MSYFVDPLKEGAWTRVEDGLPPASEKDPLYSHRVLVCFYHKQFGWIYDVDSMRLGEIRYWTHGTPWSHWAALPLSPSEK